MLIRVQLSALYLQSPEPAKSTKRSTPQAVITGTFINGESVTQAVTSATGIIVEVDAAGARLYIQNTTGTFSGDNTVTGDTSGATWNPGVTFGLAPNQTPLILALTSLATVLLLIWFLTSRSPSRALHIGLALILCGALGNLWDRAHHSEVRDFILVYLGDLQNPDWTWPNFNVADSCIVCGVILVMWDALFGHGAKQAKLKAQERKARKTAAGYAGKSAT